ncbi:hypothetical protein GP486_002192 [Trichoglossum hirsutum]|uniref:Uncharacterized protein n=1 Tax=Trichoglossum hirsutum TaxID=265104 RepID=A0A9P8LFE2_9PEZI|nr:hypothetical protein GP486_002192 [Trichoglossum hirsutum]
MPTFSLAQHPKALLQQLLDIIVIRMERHTTNSSTFSTFSWEKEFAVRRGREAYNSEDRTYPGLEEAPTTEVALEIFLAAKIDPPALGLLEFNYASIRKYILESQERTELSNLKDLSMPPTQEKVALLDDRCELLAQATGRHHKRNWVEYDDGEPRPGEFEQVVLLNERTLYERLKQKPFGFALEFHLPYYALKSSPEIPDKRSLRISSPFMPIRTGSTDEYIYEAQISFLVVGTDEWYWTAYCFVDAYFGSKESPDHYFSTGGDAPSGGRWDRQSPFWNPRDYFLRVLSQRVTQVTREWCNTVSGLEEKLRPYENTMFNGGSGVENQPTEIRNSTDAVHDYTWTVHVLRRLSNMLTKTIDAWECFEKSDIYYFDNREANMFKVPWIKYFDGIKRNINELRFLRRTLYQKMELFDSEKNMVGFLKLNSYFYAGNSN